MSAFQLEAYDMIKQKMGDKEARLLFEYIDNKVAENVEYDIKQLASKQDLMTDKRRIDKRNWPGSLRLKQDYLYCWPHPFFAIVIL